MTISAITYILPSRIHCVNNDETLHIDFFLIRCTKNFKSHSYSVYILMFLLCKIIIKYILLWHAFIIDMDSVIITYCYIVQT